MRFTLSEDQQEIKRTAKDLLAARAGVAQLREHAEAGTYDDALTKELGELGWPGIAISEEHGGQGLGLVELCVLLEELGYACAATPFLGSALAALALEHAGRTEHLAALASGEARGAFGRVGELIPDAPGADVVVLVDADGQGSFVDGSAVETVTAIDSTRSYGRVAAAGGGLGGRGRGGRAVPPNRPPPLVGARRRGRGAARRHLRRRRPRARRRVGRAR